MAFCGADYLQKSQFINHNLKGEGVFDGSPKLVWPRKTSPKPSTYSKPGDEAMIALCDSLRN